MNPILNSPQIVSDEPIEEQLRKMKSYLFRFKEEVELLLSNIDTDNLSEKFEDDFSKVVGSKIMGSKEMSQIIQSAGAIKLEVEELGGNVASLTVATNGIYNQINDPDTGILTELSILDGAIAAAVKFGTNYTGFKITTTNFHINSAGTFTVYGDNFKIDSGGDVTVKGVITALGGYIGPLAIDNDEGLKLNGYTALTQITEGRNNLLQVGDKSYTSKTVICGNTIRLFAGDSTNGIVITNKYDDADTTIRGGFNVIPSGNYFGQKTLQVNTTGAKLVDSGESLYMRWEQYGNVGPSDYIIVGSTS